MFFTTERWRKSEEGLGLGGATVSINAEDVSRKDAKLAKKTWFGRKSACPPKPGAKVEESEL